MSIEIKNVTKTFSGFSALKNVNLKVNDGELVALLGPSGSGKTTLLRVIGGIELPDEGEVVIEGKDLSSSRPQDRRVGFVFQHYALFKHMTVFDNVAFGYNVQPKKIRPAKEVIRDKVMTLLKLVQLDRMNNRFPSELSGGQRQRVALARALAIEPKVLLLDEPFGALDAKVRRDLRMWLRRLHDEIHVTSIFVTHDQEEALEVADRIAVMNEGQLIQVGTPDEVYHSPANSFVYNFLGNVNLFHARVEDGKAFLGDSVVEVKGREDTIVKQAPIYVRPHHLDIKRQTQSAHDIKGTVKYINMAGPVVKVELLNEANEIIRVELGHERFKELSLKKGEAVFISPKDVKYFNNDYSI